MKSVVLFFFLVSNHVSYGSKEAIGSFSTKWLTSLFKNHAVLVYDETHADLISTISCLLDKQQMTMVFSYHHVHTVLVPVMENLMEHASLEQMRDQLHFLVVCELSCVEYLFIEIEYLDKAFGQGSLLRHLSTWLIISSDDPPPINTTIDNVVWMSVNRAKNGSLIDSCHYESDIQIRSMFTLLWMPGRREWSCVLPSSFHRVSANKDLFPNKERGLNGREIILSTLQWTSYAIREVVDSKLHYTGVGFDIMDNLKRKFNFSYMIVEPEDNLWGQKVENGTYTGVLGMLQRKEADLCPVPYSLTLRRYLTVDFSSPIEAGEHFLMYKKSPDEALSWLFLASSFSWPVYLCGAGSLFWMILVLFPLQYIRTRRGKGTEVYNQLSQYIFNIPFRQDIQAIPESVSSRIIMFTWSLFCLLFAAGYTNNLVAITTVDRHKPPFTNLQELAYNTRV